MVYSTCAINYLFVVFLFGWLLYHSVSLLHRFVIWLPSVSPRALRFNRGGPLGHLGPRHQHVGHTLGFISVALGTALVTFGAMRRVFFHQVAFCIILGDAVGVISLMFWRSCRGRWHETFSTTPKCEGWRSHPKCTIAATNTFPKCQKTTSNEDKRIW